MTSLTKDDLPEPDTPVTTVITPIGILTLIFFKLFLLASITSKNLSDFLLSLGTSSFNFLDKYKPVKELGFSITSFGVPIATISPP